MSALVEWFAVAAISAAGTALARAYAMRRRLFDEPGARRSHAVATPRGGGAGPVIAILVWLLAMQHLDAQVALVAGAFAAVALIGAWDDHAPLPVSWRLVVHVLAGIAVAMALVDVTQAPMVFASIVAGVVVLVNVWNFMDGINGIATSQAAMVALAIALLSPAARGAGLAVAAACLGFLPFNVPRARIFLGDVGSGALGLAMAWLIARAAVREARLDTALQSMLPASAFLVDASLTLARRVLRGERWWEPHTQHLYQGLARRHGHVPVTLGYVAWTGAMMLGMLAIGGASRPLIIASVLLCYTGATLLWLALQRQVAWKRGALGMRDT